MTLQIFALVTDQGTATVESALCIEHYTDANKALCSAISYVDVVLNSWTDCTSNEELYCNICGRDSWGNADESEEQILLAEETAFDEIVSNF